MHVHSSSLSLAARLHWCHANRSWYISNGCTFLDRQKSKYFFNFFFIVVQVQLSPFPPTLLHHPSLSHLPPPSPPLLVIVQVFLITVPTTPSPLSPFSPSPLRSSHCEPTLNFSVFGYVLLPCSFCWLGSTYRWDHMVFVFYCLACST